MSVQKRKVAHLNKDVKCVWIQGPSTADNRGRAHTLALGHGVFLKEHNDWWDGYNGEDTVLIEDFTPTHSQEIFHVVRQLVKRWTFPAQIRFQVRKIIRPQCVIVTSNFTPEECFRTEPNTEFIQSCFEVIHM